MYYICIEIWEEPRLPPFFVSSPLKSGILEAHPGKICLPLIFLCLPLILIRGRQRKIMRRVGKIGRRKVFLKVKNVNVKSLKNRSKLLDFGGGSLPQPLPKGKGFSNFDMRGCAGGVQRSVLGLCNVPCWVQCIVLCRVCVGFDAQTLHFATR